MRRPLRLLLPLLAAILVLAACTGKDAVDQSAGGQYRFVSATKIGKIIPANDRKAVGGFNGTLLDGKSYELTQDAGKIVVINYWATWCGPCVTETPQLDSVYRQVKSEGIDFIGVDTKETSRGAVNSFIADNKISYPILWDEPAKTALQLGNIPAESLPFTVVLDKQHKVAAVYIGPILPADLNPVLKTLVAES